MFARLLKLLDQAYAQYSHYRVAAIVETDQGIFEGTNVENAVFPLSFCAEQVAICNAISHGARKVHKLYLLTDSTHEFGTPCGACRQVMAEFMDRDGQVIIYNKQQESIQLSVQELLPLMWNKDHLHHD